MNGDIVVPTDLDAIAEGIRQRIRRTTADIIETGKDLRFVKERVGHGQVATWINSAFGWSSRSAQRFMGASEWAGRKSDTVSLLWKRSHSTFREVCVAGHGVSWSTRGRGDGRCAEPSARCRTASRD